MQLSEAPQPEHYLLCLKMFTNRVQTNGFENFKWGSFLKDMAVGATVGAVTGAVSHVAMGIGASVGSQLGLSFSRHAIRGVTMGSIVSRDILVGAGSFLGQAGANLIGTSG